VSTNTLSISAATELCASLESRWIQCTLLADIDGLARLFHDHVVFLGSNPQMYVGQAALREYLAGVKMGGGLSIEFKDRRLQVLSPKVFATTSYVHFCNRAGEAPVYFRWGISWTVVNDAGEWKIAQHHASPRDEK